ncbi:alpha/beta hydrolase [Aromatoleum toluclasticum]|uniref:alpha/beta fold hydrolase n=1 Tax=Aromatoleum toluclasticum TaxID=92003 RepID=UPI001D17D4DB|nr:alpha/beta hydrolase [Aromatoleum toluclasticum]MCC4114743.1 alpha/beta hydrolase [Aromatoleum toluclasticum]
MDTEKSGTELRSQIVEGDGGVPIAVDFAGDPAAAGVVLIHGGGQTRHAWRNAADALIDAGYRVAAYDLRGHGDSGWAPDGDYTLDAQTGDLRAVVGRFASPPAIVGASLGGLIALTTVGEGAATLGSALVMVDVTTHVDPKGEARIIGFMQRHRDGFATLEEAAAAVADFQPHRPRDQHRLARNLRQRGGRWYWHWDPALFDTLDAHANRAGDRFLRAARRVAVPTLLVRGTHSDLVDAARADEFLSTVPNARRIDVEGARHMVVGDRNDAFNAAVIAFLKEIGGPAALH